MMCRYLRLALVSLACCLVSGLRAQVPDQSVVLQGLDEDSMRVRLLESGIQPMEGIWYYPNEEMTLGIERYHGDHNIAYRIILLASDDIDLLPGTVIGYMAPSAVDNKLKLWLYSERDRVTLLRPLECVATVSNDFSTITFDPVRWKVKVRVNLARFLPSLFSGISIYPQVEGEKLPIGFRKVFPENPSQKPVTIRYL